MTTYSIDEVITSAQHLTFKPGDLMAILTPHPLSTEQGAHIVEQMKERIPAGVHVIVLSGGVSIAKVSFEGEGAS